MNWGNLLEYGAILIIFLSLSNGSIRWFYYYPCGQHISVSVL